MGKTQSVGLLGLPFDVRDQDLPSARGAERAGRHGRLEEEEGKVGVSVSGSVGGDDCGIALSLRLSSRKIVQHSSSESRSAIGDGDVKVLGGDVDRGPSGVGNGKVEKSVVACSRGGSGCRSESGGGRSAVGLFSLDDLVDTEFLVGRVDGADSPLQGVDNVKDIVQFPDLRAVVRSAGQFRLTRRIERREPCADRAVGTTCRGFADRAEGVVDVGC